MKSKHPSESKTRMTEIVLPNDTNYLGNLRGGKILHWMDIAAAIAAGKHSEKLVVTASVDHVSFHSPIKLGDVVSIEAKVTRAFKTSMEVRLKVWAENLPTKTRYDSNEAYYTFVGLDSNAKPSKVMALVPDTEDEQMHYEKAARRRELRLILAGRMQPSDATELKSMFELQ